MTRKMNYTLWTVQWILALIFLFAGAIKLILPVAELTRQITLPGLFLRFIGVAEVLGGAGLVLPGLLRIRQELTSLAAAGLLIIMIGATALMFSLGGVGQALLPLAAGLMAGFVAWKRFRIFHRNRREQCLSPSEL
jgi:hypothetical protein